MKEGLWAAIGFALAPIIPAATMAIWSALLEERAVSQTLQFTMFLYPYSALATIVFGVPTYFLLLRLKLVNLWSTLTAGFVIGALVAFVIEMPNLVTFYEILLLGSMGAVAGLVFWLVWRLGQDRL